MEVLSGSPAMPRKRPHVSVEVPQELVAPLRAILDHLSEFRVAAASGKADFGAAEGMLGSLVARLECDGVATLLSALDPRSDRVEVDGQTYRRMNVDGQEVYKALRGEVRISRGLYRLEGVRNGPTIVPLDLIAGMVEGRYTPAAARLAATLAAELPSRSAAVVCLSAGVLPHSRAAQDRIGVEMGARWEILREKAEVELADSMEVPEETVAISVAVDRISMPMAESRPVTAGDRAAGITRPISVNYRMAFVGAVTLYDKDGEPIAAIRHAHLPEGGAAAMENSFQRALGALMRRRPDLQLVTLADGAPEMQGILDRATTGLTVAARLVDYYHLVEHLAAAIGAIGGYVPDVLGDWKGDLLEDDQAIERIEATLQSWAREYPADACPKGLHGALTYIVNHRERLRYATPRAAGLPIGSGTVEATGKAIVQVRMRRPGARWQAAGAQAIRGLRSAATSSGARWAAVTDRVLRSYRANVKQRRPRATARTHA